MATKKRKVFFFRVSTTNRVLFENILLHQTFSTTNIRHKGKCLEAKHIQQDANGNIIGVFVATKTKDVPPKHLIGSEDFDPIPLRPNEGLASANAFLYNPTLKVLALEYNRDGTFPNHISEHVVKNMAVIPQFQGVAVVIHALLALDAYNKVRNLDYVKHFKIKVANPSSTFARLAPGAPLLSSGELADLANASQMELILSGDLASGGGIRMGFIERVTDALRALTGISNVKKLEVIGNHTIGGTSQLADPIDLLVDRIRASFRIEISDIESDIRATERKHGIAEAFNSKRDEIIQILGPT